MRRKNPHRFFRLRCFVLTFLSTLIALLLFGSPILFAEDAPDAPEPSYQTDWDDNFTLLVGVRDSADAAYLRFLLLGLRPFDGTVYVAPLPAETAAAAGDRQNSLGGFAAYGGVALAAEALGQEYGWRIDRAVMITTLQLRDLVNVADGVTVNLSCDYTCVDRQTGARREYAEGKRRLDGAAFVDLMTAAETDSRLGSVLLSGRLAAELINAKLKPRESVRDNPLADYIGYMTTDLTYGDYLARADALDEIALREQKATLLLAGGAFSYGNARFTLSDEATAELDERFGS